MLLPMLWLGVVVFWVPGSTLLAFRIHKVITTTLHSHTHTRLQHDCVGWFFLRKTSEQSVLLYAFLSFPCSSVVFQPCAANADTYLSFLLLRKFSMKRSCSCTSAALQSASAWTWMIPCIDWKVRWKLQDSSLVSVSGLVDDSSYEWFSTCLSKRDEFRLCVL